MSEYGPDSQEKEENSPLESEHHSSQEEPGEEPLAEPGFLESLAGTLVDPRATLANLSRRPRPEWGLMVVGLTSLFDLIVSFSIVKNNWEGPGPFSSILSPEVVQGMALLGLFAGLILALGFWFLSAATSNLVAVLLGGNGNAAGLLTVFGFATLPQLAGTMAAVIAGLVDAPSFFVVLVSLVASLWVAGLMVIGIAEAQGLSLGRAILVFLLPLLISVLAVVMFIVAGVALWMPLIKEFSFLVPISGGGILAFIS